MNSYLKEEKSIFFVDSGEESILEKKEEDVLCVEEDVSCAKGGPEEYLEHGNQTPEQKKICEEERAWELKGSVFETVLFEFWDILVKEAAWKNIDIKDEIEIRDEFFKKIRIKRRLITGRTEREDDEGKYGFPYELTDKKIIEYFKKLKDSLNLQSSTLGEDNLFPVKGNTITVFEKGNNCVKYENGEYSREEYPCLIILGERAKKNINLFESYLKREKNNNLKCAHELLLLDTFLKKAENIVNHARFCGRRKNISTELLFNENLSIDPIWVGLVELRISLKGFRGNVIFVDGVYRDFCFKERITSERYKRLMEQREKCCKYIKETSEKCRRLMERREECCEYIEEVEMKFIELLKLI